MRKGLSILLLASFLAVLVSACGGPAEPPQVSAQPKVFRFSDTYDVKSLLMNDVDTLVHDSCSTLTLLLSCSEADGKAAIYIGDLADAIRVPDDLAFGALAAQGSQWRQWRTYQCRHDDIPSRCCSIPCCQTLR